MADERDARLILRAEDRATKTFEQVSKAIKDVTKSLDAQSKAAANGEGSLDDLKTSFRELKEAGDALVSGQALIGGFEKQSAAAERASKRLADVTAALDAYRKKAGDDPTDKQAGQIERRTDAVARAQVGFEAASKKLDDIRGRMALAGIATDNLETQFGQMGAAAVEVARGLVAAQTAIDGFEGAQSRVADEARALAAAETEAAQTVAREAAVVVNAEKVRRDAIKAGVAEALAGNAALEASFAELEATEKRLAQTNAYQKIATDSLAASGNLNRFAQTSETATVGVSRFGDAVRQIISPTVAEFTTLDGAIKRIDESADVASSSQKKRVSEYQDALNTLTQAQAGLQRQANNIQAYQNQILVVDKLTAELGQAAIESDRLANELLKAGPNADVLAKELGQANAQLERVGQSSLAARKSLVDMGDALRRAGVDTNDLVGEQTRLISSATKAGAASDILRTKVGGGAGGKGFLGLKPYELQNLSFQVNDVFTSLASGISPMQTLAQQGGQVVQIFPGIISGAIRLLPVILPLAAAIGVLAYNINETNKAAAAVKGFDALFTLSGDAAGLSAEQFGKAQIALEGFGVSADNAQKTLRTFIDAGLDPANLDTFLVTVRGLSTALGIEVPEAASKYAAAITGGYDAVASLNDITHVLTDAQLDEVRSLFDAGKAQEARTEVARLYQERAQAISDKSETEWTRSVKAFEKAFSDLNATLRLSDAASAIARIAIQNLSEDVNAFTAAVRFAKETYRTLLSISTAGLYGNDAPADPGKNVRVRLPKATNPKADNSTTGGQSYLRDQQTQLKNAKLLTAEQRLQTAEQSAANAAAQKGANDAEIKQARLNARKIEQAKLDTEAASRARSAASAARKSENEAKSAAREAETRQNRINTLTRDLENTYTSLAANKADDPFKAIQVKAEEAVRNIKAKFADLAKLGITTVGGKTEKDFEAQVKASAALETSQARQKQNEEDVNKLLELRKIALADIEDRVNSGAITPIAGIEESTAALNTLNPRIAAAAKAALDFATALRTAEPDPKLEAFISKMQSVLREAQTGEGVVTVGLKGLKEAQAELDGLLARRDAVVELQNALQKAGLKTSSEAANAIRAAFESSQPAILNAAAAVQAIIDKLLLLPGLTPAIRAALESAAAALVATRAETTLLDQDIVSLKMSAQSALANGIGTFIESLGETIARVLEGTSSLKDAFQGIAQAALQFAADFVGAIAKAIIQLVALKIAQTALKAVGFGFHEGGVVGQSQPTFTRRVSPLTFAGAVRYHDGGVAGLRPNEVPAILEKGEEVITANDPRHRSNGGGAAGGGAVAPLMIKNINLFDAGEAVSQGANTLAGEQAILNVIERNAQAVNSKLGRA